MKDVELLRRIANEQSVVEDAYLKTGSASGIETRLSKMADDGFIDWSGSLSDVSITQAGRDRLTYLESALRGPKPTGEKT